MGRKGFFCLILLYKQEGFFVWAGRVLCLTLVAFGEVRRVLLQTLKEMKYRLLHPLDIHI